MSEIKQPLGVCVVGCGFMGSKHAEAWALVPEAKIVAVVDILEDRAQRLADLYSLERYYTDYRQAIDRADVNVVSVCIPTYLHADVTIYAAELGKQILSEKPIALHIEQAEAMIAAAKKNAVQLGVGFMRRHSPVIHDLRDFLASGKLGRPVMANAADIREIRPKIEMHDATKNGGPVIDMVVHQIDEWAYIFEAEPVSVYAQGFKLASGRPELESRVKELAHDTATVVVHYASGDVGTFVVSWGLPYGVNPPGLPEQIYGPKGLAEVSFGTAHQHFWVMQTDPKSSTDQQVLRVKVDEKEWEVVSSSEENMYHREIANFARCLLNNEPLPVTGTDGLRALKTARAALESIQTGKVVEL
jgi:UDP-N-acetylglucosamine 3-dehydrogenase